MCKLLGKLLFVLIFVASAIVKINDPTPFSNLLIDRYERFQILARDYKMDSLASFISLDSLKVQANQLNTVVGIGQIVISIGVVLSVPYLSLFFVLFLISTIIIVHNPFFFEDREKFHAEMIHMILEIGMIGIALMFATNPSENKIEDGKGEKKKNKKKETKNKEEGKSKIEGNKKTNKRKDSDDGKKKSKNEESDEGNQKKKKKKTIKKRV